MTLPLRICSTARLAHHLRLIEQRQHLACRDLTWQGVPTLTLTQWLTDWQDTLLLQDIAGKIDASVCMNTYQERLLWEQVVRQRLPGGEENGFSFDLVGMAEEAMRAYRLQRAWRIPVDKTRATEEAVCFAHWCQAFRKRCRQHGLTDTTALLEQNIRQLQAGQGCLPTAIQLVGYDHISPQLQTWIDALTVRGVTVQREAFEQPAEACATQVCCLTVQEELRAAVAWAAETFARQPDARLAIVVTDLTRLRRPLATLLDDVLHPETLYPQQAEQIRCYDFSLGEALDTYPIIVSALDLLRLVSVNGMTTQTALRQVLLDQYWLGGITEADARAQLDSRMRRKLPETVSLAQFLEFAEHQSACSVLISCWRRMWSVMTRWPERQHLSTWVSAFETLLDIAGWPGERSLSSFEYQTHRAWCDALQQIISLEPLLGKLTLPEAYGHLARYMSGVIFQPEAPRMPQLQIMGLLEAAAEPLDGIWVVGMNDHVWPPPARANHFLPVSDQRRLDVPGSCSNAQLAFARLVHQRILHSAPVVIFSSAQYEGDSALRVSPLLAAVPCDARVRSRAQSLLEQTAQQRAEMEWLRDTQAPPCQENEKISGGVNLLRAQAICPAWAYYQYRLGARALAVPIDDLDAAESGKLLHKVLQRFWQDKSWQWLQHLREHEREQAIQDAVSQGMADFAQTTRCRLTAGFMKLQQSVLEQQLRLWVSFEQTRTEFTVHVCETSYVMNIAGLTIQGTIDRADRLPDGSLVLIDYKTHTQLRSRSLQEEPLVDLQLPTYAEFALHGQVVSAVSFAQVRLDRQKYIGVSARDGLLPGVDGVADWFTLRKRWHDEIQAVATAFLQGQAAVRVQDEELLKSCDVRPLLRLPERQLQYEHQAEIDDE